MGKPPADPSVYAEPHLRGGGFQPDPSEASAAANLARDHARPTTDEERLEHTVWDEPGLSPQLAGDVPEGELTYSEWLTRERTALSLAKSWWITLLVAAAAGPWAMLGAFWGEGQYRCSVIVVVVFAPVIEELMKNAAALWVVEKRPFWFRSPVQIVLCALAGGAAFAVVENALYLHAYVEDPTRLLIHWRWTVCVALHVGCSLIVGMGLLRIWRDTWQRLARPQLTLWFPYLVTGIVVHGAYNAFAVALHFAPFGF